PAGERQRIQASHDRGIGTDVLLHFMDEDVDGQSRSAAPPDGGLLYVAQIAAADSGDAEHAAVFAQIVTYLLNRELLVLQEMKDGERIEVAAARALLEAGLGRKTEACVDRLPVYHGADRRATAKMARDKTELSPRPPEKRWNVLGNIAVGRTME